MTTLNPTEALQDARPYIAKFEEDRFVRVKLVMIDKTLAQAERRA